MGQDTTDNAYKIERSTDFHSVAATQLAANIVFRWIQMYGLLPWAVTRVLHQSSPHTQTTSVYLQRESISNVREEVDSELWGQIKAAVFVLVCPDLHLDRAHADWGRTWESSAWKRLHPEFNLLPSCREVTARGGHVTVHEAHVFCIIHRQSPIT